MKTKIIFLLSWSCCLYALAPEGVSSWKNKPLVSGLHAMVVTNNPLASQAAFNILNQGGNAIDAAIAAAFVLGLTEPQSSGIGGGGYALTYEAKTQTLKAYNGREQAPKSARPNLFLKKSVPLAMLSPQSVGIPGEVALLHDLHLQQGQLPWPQLIKPAIVLAKKGFPMSPRLFGLLEADEAILTQNQEVKTIFFNQDNSVKAIGTGIKNPAYAASLEQISADPRSFYTGKLAHDIIRKVNQVAKKDLLRASDFRQYQLGMHPVLCAPFRNYTICSTGAETGGVTVLELLGIYQHNYSGKSPLDHEWAFQFLQASKLAFADRNQYIADPSFVPSVHAQLLDPNFIQKRASLVGEKALKIPVKAGTLKTSPYAPDPNNKAPGTTSLSIVDSSGNAISMTITVEHQFGSHIFVDGFFLNNQLTDFSFKPVDKQGNPIANSVQAHKRPRSAISPTMVFNSKHRLISVTGSPGGAQIICYVAKNLIYMLDFKKDPRESSASGNLCSDNVKTQIENKRPLMQFIPALKKQGEQIQTTDMVSGVTNILKGPKKQWLGAADPRREGMALGK